MDKKAKDILFKTYWTSSGWTSDEKRKTNPDDFQYAKSKGLMFDNLTISKSELISRLDKILENLPVEIVTNAFLSSLTNKRLDWRSGLASYVKAKRLLTDKSIHQYHFGYGENIDLNVLNFERLKWGGVRHGYGIYNLLDLELINKEVITKPTKADIEQFKNILRTIKSSNPDDTPSKLRDNLANVFKASKNERHMLMEILGCADILQPLKFDRKEPVKHDWTFVLYWRGEDKYNEDNVKTYFGEYGIE